MKIHRSFKHVVIKAVGFSILAALLCGYSVAYAIEGNWSTQADGYRGKNGQRITFTFPGGGSLSSRLWGTGVYTDDSSIATAAVHAGLITPGMGGTVTIEILPGQGSYMGSMQNGAKSNDYGGWHGSFRFVGGPSHQPHQQTYNQPGPNHAGVQGTWATQADSYRGKNSQRITFNFPGGGTLSSRLWGTGVYTDDSSIATAAVHAGLITPGMGGTVTVEILPGQGSYRGSMQNGAKSNDYGGWHGSFRFVGGPSHQPHQQTYNQPGPHHAGVQGTWATQADSYRGKNGQRITFNFPGGGALSSRLWGTGVYTDDSSIATAAVHAGLITTGMGGTVTIEILPGQGSYSGSMQNGAKSNDYGGWHGSFRFVY